MKRTIKILLVLSIFAASSAWSATNFFSAQIERILHVPDETFGGCMAKLNVTLASQGLDCRSKWVSFSCTGDFAPRQAAKTNFELAQLAFALGSEVRLLADDSRQHNNYCFASRIDVLR